MDVLKIISYAITFLSMFIGIFSIIWVFRQKKREEKIIRNIRKENEEFNYYLKAEIPKNIQERYLNNITHFNNTNFEFEDIDRLFHEIKKLRRDIQNSNNIKIQKITDCLNESMGKDFNYNELVFQLSQMTNIQYLFELLNNQKSDEYRHVKNVLSDIVHTIRNPSSGMRAVIEILKIDNANNYELLNKLKDLENYIDEIENNLNAYYQISSFSHSLSCEGEKIQLKDELEARGKLLTISLGKKIELKNNFCDICLERNIVEVLLLAITCIWENAIDFSKDNGVISTNTIYSDNILTVEIINDGPIIKKELLSSVFEQGFSTRGSTGRGLAIVKQAVEKTLNGIVSCENIGDEYGVKFTIIIEVEKTSE